jgi:GNAT superfamily N-acetyltransferase
VKFIDLDFARRVEMAEANAAKGCGAALTRLHPDFPVALENIGGGIALFAGPDSPVTQAIGVGLHGEVSDADLDDLTDFFLSRGAPAAAEVCPLVDMKLYERFAARGYRLLEVSDVLYLELEHGVAFGELPRGVTVRAIEPHELKLWTATVAQGFAEHYPVTPELLDVMEGFAHRPDAESFLAYVDGEVAGGGVASAFEKVGGLFGASTLPAYRRRGVQRALLEARIEWARARGCDLAVSMAQPGSASHRNIERFGFRIAYTRTKLIRPLDAAAAQSPLPTPAA